MHYRNYLDSDVRLKEAVKTSNPILLVAIGLTGAETIAVEVLNDGSVREPNIDPLNDAIWSVLTEGGNNIVMDVDTNNVFLQAPAQYRIQVSTTPASQVKVVGYVYD